MATVYSAPLTDCWKRTLIFTICSAFIRLRRLKYELLRNWVLLEVEPTQTSGVKSPKIKCSKIKFCYFVQILRMWSDGRPGHSACRWVEWGRKKNDLLICYFVFENMIDIYSIHVTSNTMAHNLFVVINEYWFSMTFHSRIGIWLIWLWRWPFIIISFL